MKHDVDEILRVLERLLPDHARVTDIDYLTGGYSNQNYRIRIGRQSLVLRLCRRVPQDPDAEISYLTQPHSPRLVAYDRSTGHMATLLVEGTPLFREPFSVEESACYLRQIHAVIPSGIRTHNPVAVCLDHFRKSGVKNELREFVETTRWRPRQVTGCHNDLNPYNIIRTNAGSIVTLDWEFAGDNEKLFDLVNLSHGLGYSDEEFEECGALYMEHHYEMEYLVLTRLIFLVREHSWALAQAAMGNDRKEVLAQAQEAESEFQRVRRKYS